MLSFVVGARVVSFDVDRRGICGTTVVFGDANVVVGRHVGSVLLTNGGVTILDRVGVDV